MRLDLLVNTFTAHAWFRRKIRVFGGSQWRPNLHVQDAAEAFIAAAEAPEARVSGEVFNVGGDAQNHTVLEIAQRVRAQLPETEVEVTREGSDCRDYRVSFAKIRRTLRFAPRFSVEDGVAELIERFRAGEITQLDDVRYHNCQHLRTHGFGEAPAMVAVTER
jgi:nucleoside-diphosphate-sugar epimerase